jgi:hypothetical protein
VFTLIWVFNKLSFHRISQLSQLIWSKDLIRFSGLKEVIDILLNVLSTFLAMLTHKAVSFNLNSQIEVIFLWVPIWGTLYWFVHYLIVNNGIKYYLFNNWRVIWHRSHFLSDMMLKLDRGNWHILWNGRSQRILFIALSELHFVNFFEGELSWISQMFFVNLIVWLPLSIEWCFVMILWEGIVSKIVVFSSFVFIVFATLAILISLIAFIGTYCSEFITNGTVVSRVIEWYLMNAINNNSLIPRQLQLW